jgi:6-phosphogluconolactonase (cycloisomerase 2 family)
MFAIAGNWHFTPGPKGISVFRYDPDTGHLELLDTSFTGIAAGQQYLDTERRILYAANECGNKRGEIGGGGYVAALKFDPETGKLDLLGEKESLAAFPCYLCLDRTKRYLLAAHHSDGGHVTKITRNPEGIFTTRTLFDDTALVLFRINIDGTLGEICDVSITSGEGIPGSHALSRQHSVLADPSGELFVVCDKGTDKIYTYHLDREKGRLLPLAETITETGSAPRYGAFHPRLPIFYVNFERKPVLHGYHYHVDSGKLEQTSSVPLLKDGEGDNIDRVESSDLTVHQNGRRLYAAVRGVNRIAALDIDNEGRISMKKSIDCGGEHPRGLRIAPDGRFLLCANMVSGNITVFAIHDDGSLEVAGDVKAPCPANISIAAF